MKNKGKQNRDWFLNGTFRTEDLNSSLDNYSSSGKGRLFLGRFSPEELMKIMEKVGLSSFLLKKGFKYNDLLLKISIDESMVNSLRLYYKEEDPDKLMIDLRMSEVKFVPILRGKKKNTTVYDMIVTEWLSTQDPLKREFDEKKPRLPGQLRPGLGVLKYCFEMMYRVAREVFKDGFMDVPDHMHGAIMYSKKYMFYNPAHEAILKAIMRDLWDYPLMDISWGMITGTIREKNSGKSQEFSPSEQIFPVSDRMKEYFQSKEYRDRFNSVFKKKQYMFDYDLMVKKREEMLKGSGDLK